ERRSDDWILQYNLAAHELTQNGRQILTSLIAEQIALREYLNLSRQSRNQRGDSIVRRCQSCREPDDRVAHGALSISSMPSLAWSICGCRHGHRSACNSTATVTAGWRVN